MKNNAKQNNNTNTTTNAMSIEAIIAQALAPVQKNAKHSDKAFNIHNCSFPSVPTSFGKVWAAKTKGVSLWVDGQPTDKTFLSRLTQGMLTDVPTKEHQHFPTYKRIKQSLMDMFKTKSYALTGKDRNNILAYMPSELCKDLQVLRNLGIKQKFTLEVADDDNAVSVKAIKYVPKFNKSTETQVSYGNIGTEASTVYVGNSQHPFFPNK